MTFRAVDASRHDLARGGRNVAYFEELFLHLLQPVRRLHHIRDGLERTGILHQDRRLSQRHHKHCVRSSQFPEEPRSVLHQLDHTPRTRVVSLPSTRVRQRRLVSHLPNRRQDSSRYIVYWNLN